MRNRSDKKFRYEANKQKMSSPNDFFSFTVIKNNALDKIQHRFSKQEQYINGWFVLHKCIADVLLLYVEYGC